MHFLVDSGGGQETTFYLRVASVFTVKPAVQNFTTEQL